MPLHAAPVTLPFLYLACHAHCSFPWDTGPARKDWCSDDTQAEERVQSSVLSAWREATVLQRSTGAVVSLTAAVLRLSPCVYMYAAVHFVWGHPCSRDTCPYGSTQTPVDGGEQRFGPGAKRLLSLAPTLET